MGRYAPAQEIGIPIQYEIDVARRRLVACASADLTLDYILAVLTRIYADPKFGPGFDQLCDLGDADVNLEGHSGPRFTEAISAAGARDAGRIAGGRLALVTRKPHIYGLLRMLETISDEVPIEIGVFWHREAAEGWLSRPRASALCGPSLAGD